jgi:hypothetical protein
MVGPRKRGADAEDEEELVALPSDEEDDEEEEEWVLPLCAVLAPFGYHCVGRSQLLPSGRCLGHHTPRWWLAGRFVRDVFIRADHALHYRYEESDLGSEEGEEDDDEEDDEDAGEEEDEKEGQSHWKREHCSTDDPSAPAPASTKKRKADDEPALDVKKVKATAPVDEDEEEEDDEEGPELGEDGEPEDPEEEDDEDEDDEPAVETKILSSSGPKGAVTEAATEKLDDEDEEDWACAVSVAKQKLGIPWRRKHQTGICARARAWRPF